MSQENKLNGDKGRFSPLVSLSVYVNNVCEMLLFVLLLVMIALTTAQVVCRMVTQALTWSEELTRFLLVTVSLLGAAVAFFRGSHIAVTILVDNMPRALKSLVFVLMQLLGIVFFCVLAYYGRIIMQREAFQITPALGLSMSVIYAQFPVFSAVVVLHLLANIEKFIRGGAK